MSSGIAMRLVEYGLQALRSAESVRFIFLNYGTIKNNPMQGRISKSPLTIIEQIRETDEGNGRELSPVLVTE